MEAIRENGGSEMDMLNEMMRVQNIDFHAPAENCTQKDKKKI